MNCPRFPQMTQAALIDELKTLVEPGKVLTDASSLDAFGKDWFDVREAEISIFKPDGADGYRLVGRVQADEWASLAQ